MKPIGQMTLIFTPEREPFVRDEVRRGAMPSRFEWRAERGSCMESSSKNARRVLRPASLAVCRARCGSGSAMLSALGRGGDRG